MNDLTPRELEAIAAYRLGGSEERAAAILGISRRTLKVHLANARRKRDVHRTWMLFGDIAA